MPDQITTKPMRSRAQWRFLFANDMPFARRWARETPGGPKKRYQRLPVKVKAPNYGARAGQTIAGNLRRGASGQFESGGATAAPAKRKPPKVTRGRKPAKTPDQRQQERAQAQQQRTEERQRERIAQRDAVLASFNIDPGASEALVMLAGGEQPEPAAIARAGFVEAGLVERARDGSYRMTAAGRQLLNAAARGDKGRAGEIISRSRDRQAERAERQQAKPKPAASGGGKKPKKLPAVRRTPIRSSSRPQAARTGATPEPRQDRAEPTSPHAALAQRLSDGEELSAEDAATLVRNGLARRNRDGSLSLTAMGQRAIRTKAFTVYKDARGELRWVAYSSNAYRDRDEEIVSTKALTEDCARADAAGDYGPLRWWHVPGWELGACDFNAMHGRVLVESGTFKSDAIGRAVSLAAPSLQLSIGFTHAPDEPDRHGVFHHIQRFERSLVPGGRAANPFTRLIVKETRMDTEKEAALKATLGADAAAQVLQGADAVQKDADDRQTAYKGDDPWAALGAQIAQTIKSAVAPAVATVAATPEPVAEKAAADEIEAKAPMDEMAVVEEVEPVAEEPGDMTYDEFVQTIRSVVREELAAELKAQIAPLAGMLDIEKKVGSAVQSLMQPYQQQQATKDDARTQEIATLKARIAELEGDIPAAFRPFAGFHASTDESTVLKGTELSTPPEEPDSPFVADDGRPIFEHFLGAPLSQNGRA